MGIIEGGFLYGIQPSYFCAKKKRAIPNQIPLSMACRSANQAATALVGATALMIGVILTDRSGGQFFGPFSLSHRNSLWRQYPFCSPERLCIEISNVSTSNGAIRRSRSLAMQSDVWRQLD